jgi:hypothetical protein
MRDKIARGEGDFSHDHNSYRSPVMPMCLLVLALFLLSAMVNRSMILDANCSLHLVFRLLKFIYRMQHQKKSHTVINKKLFATTTNRKRGMEEDGGLDLTAGPHSPSVTLVSTASQAEGKTKRRILLMIA